MANRHSKRLGPAAMIKFMRENGHEWVGQYEAALFITEFANELNHGGGKHADETLGN